MKKQIKAVIDIGTNTVRLMVVADMKERMEVLSRAIRVCRIGEGFSAAGNNLLPEAVKRTLNVLQEFKNLALEANAEKIITVATSAVREAQNRDFFISEVKIKTGLNVTVLKGEREALLSHRGAAISLNLSPEMLMVFDLGGGSTELVWRDDNLIKAKSYPVGVVKIQEKFKLSEDCNREKIELVNVYLTEVFNDMPRLKSSHLLAAVGGTVTSLAAIDKGLPKYSPSLVNGSKLSLLQTETMGKLLMETPLVQRREIPGLMPERADVIIAGVLITAYLMRKLCAGWFYVSEGDLMLGLLAKKGCKFVYESD